VYTVLLAGKSLYIRSYTVCIYGFGQPYKWRVIPSCAWRVPPIVKESVIWWKKREKWSHILMWLHRHSEPDATYCALHEAVWSYVKLSIVEAQQHAQSPDCFCTRPFGRMSSHQLLKHNSKHTRLTASSLSSQPTSTLLMCFCLLLLVSVRLAFSSCVTALFLTWFVLRFTSFS